MAIIANIEKDILSHQVLVLTARFDGHKQFSDGAF